MKTSGKPAVLRWVALGCLVVSTVAEASRLTVSGFAEPTLLAGASASWLRSSPGGAALFLVLIEADRPGFDGTGRVRWIVRPDGRRLPDGTPVATLEGDLSRSELWPTELVLDPARFSGHDDGLYPSLDEPPPMAILVEGRMTQPDADGDGVPDTSDAFPYDPRESLDTDEDGMGNNTDPDDDGDLIPDAYEIAFHLDPLARDSLTDLDDDGQSNLDEYRAGTAADQGSSWFRVQQVSLPGRGKIRLQWLGVPGRVYAIIRRSGPLLIPEEVDHDISVDVLGPLSRDLDTTLPTALYFLQVRVAASP